MNLVDGGYQSAEPSAPQAHVNIIIFDKNHNFIDLAYEQISAAGEQVGVSPDVDHEYLMKEYTIKEAGFVYLYVSNNSPVNVYFDDVIITRTPTNVIQYNEYYPFGMQTQNSWTRADNSNNFLYNGGSELNKDAGWYETFFRGYDAALGRFSQVDPLASASMQFSPYAFAFNDPVFYNDPGGAYPENTYVPQSWDNGAYGPGSGGDAVFEDLNPTFGRHQYGQHSIAYGSGNHWADGIQYSDWSAHGGSQMFRDAKANGARLLGGTQYVKDGDGTYQPLTTRGGQLGYWEMRVGQVADAESSNGFALATEMLFHAQQGHPTIFLSFSNLPKDFDKAAYFDQLRRTLIENGFSNSLQIEEYSLGNKLKAWWNNSPTGTITFTHHYGDMPMDAGGHAVLNNPNSIIIYPGLSGQYGQASLGTWLYVNATLHEIGHGFFGFEHDASGNTLGPASVMDYRYAFDQGMGFNLDQRLHVAASIWGNQ